MPLQRAAEPRKSRVTRQTADKTAAHKLELSSDTRQKYWAIEQAGHFWCGAMETDEGASEMLRVIRQRNTLSDGSSPVFTLREVSKAELDQFQRDQIWFDFLNNDYNGRPS